VLIRGDYEIVDGRRVFRQACDPEAGGDRRMGEPVLLDEVEDALGVREAAGLRRVHQDDRELVAAVPGHDAEAARVLDQELGDLAQDLVPGAVTEPVVDLLEVIQVQQRARERLPGRGSGPTYP